tara:strand:- start:481 stop:687 length:207 start_codon:yes stop_codon:yes gene_type:complete
MTEYFNNIMIFIMIIFGSQKKLDENLNVLEEAEAWPLEVTDWNGDNIRYAHPQGTTILYESSKLIHGK